MELRHKSASYRLPSTSAVHPQITEDPTVTTDPVTSKPRRLILKNGECNVKNINVPRRALRYLADHYTTFLEQRWRIVIIVFFGCFFTSWFVFTLAWFTLATLHDDFSEHEPGFTPCIWNIQNFASVFLFSMETQTTIGYGFRYVSEECNFGIFLLVLQSVFGALLQSILAGTVLAKLLMPKKRAKTVLFSKRCCVCVENGQLCLMFRIGNLRHSPVLGATIRAFFLWHDDLPDDDDSLSYRLKEMEMDEEEGNTNTHLWWPSIMIHRITKSSPLYNISNKTLKTRRFEIIVILEGSVGSTSLIFQARKSYLETDILWGYRFMPLFNPQKTSRSKFPIDFKNFDAVYKVHQTPTFCAKEHDENQNEAGASMRDIKRSYNIVE